MSKSLPRRYDADRTELYYNDVYDPRELIYLDLWGILTMKASNLGCENEVQLLERKA